MLLALVSTIETSSAVAALNTTVVHVWRRWMKPTNTRCARKKTSIATKLADMELWKEAASAVAQVVMSYRIDRIVAVPTIEASEDALHLNASSQPLLDR